MSLPFKIGDVVEVDEEKLSSDVFLADLVGKRAVVETMGLRWIKVKFTDKTYAITVSANKFKKAKFIPHNKFHDLMEG
jgi:predicted RNA-binding protein associated with RNAse of E/G family